jgi:hypothetical protein
VPGFLGDVDAHDPRQQRVQFAVAPAQFRGRGDLVADRSSVSVVMATETDERSCGALRVVAV